MLTFRVIGPGRAGQAIQVALERAGWRALAPLGRGDHLAGAASGADVVLVATPDAAIAPVARAVTPAPRTALVHLAGSLGPDELLPHARRAAVHPLVSLPEPHSGAERLRGAAFAVAGDSVAYDIVAALDGRPFAVADEHRAAYHAAACIASNHLVALLGQVERVAATVGVPLDAFLDLARGSLDNVAASGPGAALTGPVARGDWATVERHLAALAPHERPAYEAMVALARVLAGGPAKQDQVPCN